MAVSDELLRRGAKELLSDQWQVLRNDASVDISFKRLNGPCLLRLPYKVPMPGNVDLSTLADMPRPEIFCNRKELRAMGVQLEAFDIQQVDKVFSPGDCFVSSRHDSECNDLFAEMKQVGALVGALAAPEPDSAPKPELTERLLTWRNFPVESALTIIAVPFDEEAQMFRYQYRQHFTCICVLIPSRALEAADAQQEDGKNELQVLIGLFTEDVASWATDAIQVLHGAMSQLVQREMYLLVATCLTTPVTEGGRSEVLPLAFSAHVPRRVAAFARRSNHGGECGAPGFRSAGAFVQNLGSSTSVNELFLCGLPAQLHEENWCRDQGLR